MYGADHHAADIKSLCCPTVCADVLLGGQARYHENHHSLCSSRTMLGMHSIVISACHDHDKSHQVYVRLSSEQASYAIHDRNMEETCMHARFLRVLRASVVKVVVLKNTYVGCGRVAVARGVEHHAFSRRSRIGCGPAS